MREGAICISFTAKDFSVHGGSDAAPRYTERARGRSTTSALRGATLRA